MAQIKLYRKDGACSWVPHALLRHLAIPFTAVPMHATMTSGSTSGYAPVDGSLTREQYRKIHPDGYVPALVVDGEIITEMPAVLIMIAQLAPDRDAGETILGRTPLEKAKVIEWLSWLSATLHSIGFVSIWRPGRFADQNTETHLAIKEKGNKVVRSCFERIEYRLSDNSYAVGEGLTVVDLNLYLFWRWGYEAGFDMAKEFPAYGRMVRHVEVLEGVRSASREEGLELYFEADASH